MKSLLFQHFFFLFCLFLPAGLFPVCFGAAIPVSCGSIYKSFAQCLVALGDSLVETEKNQDIDAICRCALKKIQLALKLVLLTFQLSTVVAGFQISFLVQY